MIKKLILVISFLLSAACYATTINAASCSQQDVTTAIGTAAANDTVVIPSTSCTYTTWNGAGTPSVLVNKSITLQGGTTCSGQAATLSCTDNTIITDSTGTGFNEVPFILNCSNCRLTGITIIGGVAGDSKYFIQTTKNTTGWRIDHSHLHLTVGTSTSGIQAFGYGLIDHVYFTDLNTIVSGDGSDSRDGTYGGDYNWSQALSPGTVNEMYMEDNEIANTSGTVLNGIDNYCGSRWVFRYNDVKNTNIADHGLDSTSDCRSALLAEVYNNTFLNQNGSNIFQWYTTRGGTSFVFGNTISAANGSYSRYIDMREYRADSNTYPQWGQCGGSTAIDQNTASQHGWACRDQVGRGPESNAANDWPAHSPPTFSEISSPLYSWNNSYKGSIPGSGDFYACNNAGNCTTSDANLYQIIVNRDYYGEAASFNGTSGTGTGTLASRPGTCTPSVAYWATDQSILYQCGGGNSWSVYYSPYQYPHPLQGNPIADTPTFSPPAGTYGSTQSVTISTTSSGAIICYNAVGSPQTNGSNGCTVGTLYASPVSVSYSQTLYAVAGGTGYTDSPVGSAAYTIGTANPGSIMTGNTKRTANTVMQ